MAPLDSSYNFPVFISSGIYGLIDLRAELSKHLTDLGYQVLSSDSPGFHDNTPDVQPYESCLDVLSTSFIMILVIDGKYGMPFTWNHYNPIFGDREISPTHAEYLFAREKKIRILIFIREQVFHLYQNYVTAFKNAKGDKEVTKGYLKNVLPKNIDIGTLEFIHEIKTTDTKHWVRPFKDVTDIKDEVQKKMLNELAELFLIKNKHIDIVTRAFSSAITDLTKEKRLEILKNIGVTRDLIEQFDSNVKIIEDLRNKANNLDEELTAKNQELANVDQTNKEAIAKLESTIQSLLTDRNSTVHTIVQNEFSNANSLLSSPGYLNMNNVQVNKEWENLVYSVGTPYTLTTIANPINWENISKSVLNLDGLLRTNAKLQSIDPSILRPIGSISTVTTKIEDVEKTASTKTEVKSNVSNPEIKEPPMS